MFLCRKRKCRRQQDGGPDTGGTLKIYGESLCKDVPYKTLLLSVRETAQYVVREMLDKYALDKEDPANYCLVQVRSFFINFNSVFLFTHFNPVFESRSSQLPWYPHKTDFI